ncbi:MAG: Lrp/AsnC family transcriptional regulator [Candidatus Promineifilaceae bacterium]|jgi:DNA-binding Lrp family transcriptional regulator
MSLLAYNSEYILYRTFSMKKPLDHKDKVLLRLLQDDARLTSTELAKRVDLSTSGLQKRVRKLEDMEVIESYRTMLNREALGYDMLCFVQVTLQRHEPEAVRGFRELVQDMPEVMECFHLTGEYDYLLKIVVRNRKHLEKFLVETLTPVKGMDKIRTSLVLNEIKATTSLPIENDDNPE